MSQKAPTALAVTPENQGKIIGYLSKNGDDISFAEFFWKGCEPHISELRRYPLYARTLLMFTKGKSLSEIANVTGVNSRSIGKWIGFKQKPKLAHFLSLYLQLGRPKPGWVWLSVNNTSGHAIPLGPMIEVPARITHWNDVAHVLAQLRPLRDIGNTFSREYMVGFLIGMVIGDSAKSRYRRTGTDISASF